MLSVGILGADEGTIPDLLSICFNLGIPPANISPIVGQQVLRVKNLSLLNYLPVLEGSCRYRYFRIDHGLGFIDGGCFL